MDFDLATIIGFVIHIASVFLGWLPAFTAVGTLYLIYLRIRIRRIELQDKVDNNP